MSAVWRRVLALIALVLAAGLAHAHSASTAYLDVARDGDGATRLTWRIALRDLDALLDLDADDDGRLRWGEVVDRALDVDALAGQRLQLTRDGRACAVAFDPPRFVRLGELGFAQLDGRADCDSAATLRYDLFLGLDAGHRAVVQLDGGAPRLVAPGETLALDAAPATPGTLSDTLSGTRSGTLSGTLSDTLSRFARAGIGHILSGIDHLLFLVALMLPAVVTRSDGAWTARGDRRAALLQVMWIATAFTLAHSLTLAVATLGWLRVAPAVIEPLVALTVLAAALNNLKPVVTRRLAAVAFAFGLIHGFAFAEVLAPLELPRADLARALLGFNLGVEAGQMLVVAASFALLAWAARWRGYGRWVLRNGSVAVALLAVVWIVERVFESDWGNWSGVWTGT